MSVDWEKYSTRLETRDRAKTPKENGVVSLNVGGIRAVPGQSVLHTPILENRAHTDVLGEKSPEARVLLRRIARWVVNIE